MSRAKRTRGLAPATIGAIVIGITVMLTYLNFAKELPWTQHYEVKGIFRSANNIFPSSPVRIAGIQVGKVSNIEQIEGKESAIVTMQISDEGRPIRKDATAKIRPRLFLEGNFFVDLRPGTPGQPELNDGDTLNIDQTASPVQVDQLLATLQTDVRADLQNALEEIGSALEVHGGARGFNEAQKFAGPAFRDTARVNEALLGTRPHDLSGLVRNLNKVVRGLGRNEEQLKDFVTNFRITAGAFAAEDEALEAAIRELPDVLEAAEPALASLNASFPPLRSLAREILPGTKNSVPTLDASIPFIKQARRLVSQSELKGLVADLETAVPDLAALTKRATPLFEEVRALSSCFDGVVNPWARLTVPDPEFPAAGQVYKEATYGFTGLAGESRSHDANGEYARVTGGGGDTTVAFGPDGTPAFAQNLFPILGVRPALSSSARTPFKPEEPCENQEVANLDSGGLGEAPPQQNARKGASPALLKSLEEIGKVDALIKRDLLNAQQLRANGLTKKADSLMRSVRKRRKRFNKVLRPKLDKLLGVRKVKVNGKTVKTALRKDQRFGF